VQQARAEQVAARLVEDADAGRLRSFERFSLVFLDPPYELSTEALESLLTVLAPVLTEDAVVVIERSSRSRPVTWPEGFLDDGTKTYGETVLQYGGPGD
jgi:16S rRNA (guanine966-N2)-methyltransferase